MKNRFKQLFRVVVASALISAGFVLSYFVFQPAAAVTTVPTTMNFQGRLLDSVGVARPDGLYNMQFRIYTVASGGTAVWTETRETTNRVQVTNGLFSTQLGQVTPIPAALFASGNLFFEVTMATPATAVCTTAACASWEAAMTPRQILSTSAYAYNAETLDGLDSASFAAATGSTSYIQNQATLTAVQPSSNLWISGTARADTSVLTPTLDTATAVAFNIGTTNASSVNISKSGSPVSIKSLTTAGVVTTSAAGQLSSSARLAVATGGTNAATIGGAGSVAYSTGSAYAFSAAGTSGQCLQSGGTSSPTWGACGATITVGTINSQTKSSNGAVLSGNTLYMQTADATNPGLMSTGAQVFSGDKVFRSNSTNAFEIQNSGGSSLLRADTTTNKIHIASALNIQGATATSTALQVTGDSLLKATVSGTGPTTLFSDGFESNNFSAWTSAQVTGTVNSTVKNTGTYAAKFTTSGTTGSAEKLLASPQTTMYATSYINITSADTTQIGLMAFDSPSYSLLVQRLSDGKVGVWNGFSSTGANSSASVMSLSTWHKVQLRVTFGNPGTVDVYVDDAPVAGLTGLSYNMGLETYDTVVIGSGVPATHTMYFDDVSVTNGPGSATSAGGNLIVEGSITTNATSAAYTQRLCHDQSNGATTSLKLGDCAAAGQADLAEFYATDGRVEPGDIVAPTATGGVMGATAKTYQSNMIGIVSTNPIADGIIGWNEKSANRQPIALAGRVPLKVSLENGDIHAGDSLTASSTPGVAMRATKAGRIIGYALEDYTASSVAVSEWVAREESDRNKAHAGTLPQYVSKPANWVKGVGKIMAFANASYTDPTPSLQGSEAGLLTKVNGKVATDSLNVSGSASVHTLTVSSSLTTVKLVVTGHLVSGGQTPIIKALSACKLDGLKIRGTDIAGEISFKAVDNCQIDSSAISVAFAQPYSKTPHVVVSGQNKVSGAVMPYSDKATDRGFNLGIVSPLQKGQTYRFTYHAIE